MLPGGAAASGRELKAIHAESVAQGGAIRPDHGESDPVLAFREFETARSFGSEMRSWPLLSGPRSGPVVCMPQNRDQDDVLVPSSQTEHWMLDL